MRRQRRTVHNIMDDNYYTSGHILSNGDDGTVRESDDWVQMARISQNQRMQQRFENTIEAKVEEGDTLQALALKFHCTVADIKRINKIDKDNEIYARKVIKIPVTVHSVLLGTTTTTTLPTIHRSGSNSPNKKTIDDVENDTCSTNLKRNPLEDTNYMLSEKLIVASVNAAGEVGSCSSNSSTDINKIILNSKLIPGTNFYTDEDADVTNNFGAPLDEPLLTDPTAPRLHRIPGPSLSTFDWSGSDCDISWVCLFIVILALCFAIPLIYIVYLAEHPQHHHHDVPKH